MESVEHYSSDIENLERESPAKGTFEVYKKLKKLGFSNEDILLILDRFYMNRSYRQILEDRGWTSYGTLYRRARELQQQLKFVLKEEE